MSDTELYRFLGPRSHLPTHSPLTPSPISSLRHHLSNTSMALTTPPPTTPTTLEKPIDAPPSTLERPCDPGIPNVLYPATAVHPSDSPESAWPLFCAALNCQKENRAAETRLLERLDTENAALYKLLDGLVDAKVVHKNEEFMQAISIELKMLLPEEQSLPAPHESKAHECLELVHAMDERAEMEKAMKEKGAAFMARARMQLMTFGKPTGWESMMEDDMSEADQRLALEKWVCFRDKVQKEKMQEEVASRQTRDMDLVRYGRQGEKALDQKNSNVEDAARLLSSMDLRENELDDDNEEEEEEEEGRTINNRR